MTRAIGVVDSGHPHQRYSKFLQTADVPSSAYWPTRCPELPNFSTSCCAPRPPRATRRRRPPSGARRRRSPSSPPTGSAPRSPGSAMRPRFSRSSATSTRSASRSPTSTSRASSGSPRSAAGTRRSWSASGSRSARADGVVPGVVGRKPIHLLEADQRKKVVELKGLHIDIGAADRDEAAELVRVGDPVVIAAEPVDARRRPARLAGDGQPARLLHRPRGAAPLPRARHPRAGSFAAVAGGPGGDRA